MDNQFDIFKRSFNYLFAILGQKAITTIIHLLKHPIFIFYLGTSMYGEWLILMTLPAFLSLYEIGFSTAAINSISMAYAKNNIKLCQKIFFSILITLLFFASLLFLFSYFVIINFNFLGNYFDIVTENEAKIYVILVIAYLIMGNISGYFSTLLHTIKLYSYSVNLKNIFIVLEFIASIISLIIYNEFFFILISLLVVRFFRIIFMIIISIKKIYWIEFNIKLFSFYEIKKLFIPSFTFLFPPIIIILKSQAIILVIAYYFESSLITAFVLMLTLSRLLVPIGTLMANSLKIELNQLYSMGEIKNVLKIFFFHIQIVFYLLIVFYVLLLLMGSNIFFYWTLDQVKFDSLIFLILCTSSFIAAISGPIQLIIYGTNNHSLYSTYLLIIHLIIFVVSIFMFKYFKLISAPIAILLMEFFTVTFAILFTSKITKKSSLSIFINSIKFPRINILITYTKEILKNFKLKSKFKFYQKPK